MINAAGFEIAALLAGCGLTAVVILLRAAWPSLAARADAAAETRGPGLRFVLGLLNGPALFLLASALGARKENKPLSAVVLGVLIALALWGFLGDLPRLGRRILALGLLRQGYGGQGLRESSVLGETLAAGAALAAALLLPFVGWIAFGLAFLLAVGTGVSALFTRRPRPS
jgi:hypothetical protein